MVRVRVAVSGVNPTDWQAAPAPNTRHGSVPAAVGAVVHLLAADIENGRDLSSMSGILADRSYGLLPV